MKPIEVLIKYLEEYYPGYKEIAKKFGITQDEAMKVFNARLILTNFAERHKDKLK